MQAQKYFDKLKPEPGQTCNSAVCTVSKVSL